MSATGSVLPPAPNAREDDVESATILYHGRLRVTIRKATNMSGLDPMLVPGFIYLLLAGWNWSQATANRKQAAEYRAKKAALDTREHALSEDQARLDSEARSPRAIPARVYDLTYRMLEHAVHAELADLAVFSLTESPDTCQMVVDQCVAVADAILNGRSPSGWPPAEEDIRLAAAVAVSGLEASGEQIAHTGPPAEAGDEAVYAYLARVVVAGEPAASVFPPGEAVVLPVWATAAMLVSFLPLRPWQAHLEIIWQMEDDDGVNFTALAALDTRARRRHYRPAAPDPE
jgi:hypothetical protein